MGEAEYSPQVGIESHPHTTEVEEEKDDVQISDMDSENYGEGDFANPPTQNNFESPVDPTDFATSSDAETGIMTDPECLEENWGNFYQNCPRWKNLWIGTQNRLVPWQKESKPMKAKCTSMNDYVSPTHSKVYTSDKITPTSDTRGQKNFGKCLRHA